MTETIYVLYQSSSDTVQPSDCTTRWSDNIHCNIPLSGIYDNKYTNLMIMEGDPEEIRTWISENSGKVTEKTLEAINLVGQTIVPEGTEFQTENSGEVMVSQLFDINVGVILIPKE